MDIYLSTWQFIDDRLISFTFYYERKVRRMSNPIIRRRVRILRPDEHELLRSGLSDIHLIQYEAAFYTGMRWIELQRLQEHPNWLDGRFINLPKGAAKKQKIEFDERTVRLNKPGEKAVATFLNRDIKLPTRAGWGQILKRCAGEVGLINEALCAKTTRKTWESWCVIVNKENNTALNIIVLSQGHTKETSVKHYLGLPFTPKDEAGMVKYVAGVI